MSEKAICSGIPPLESGRRLTLPRRLVWDALERLGPHRTADEIASDLEHRQVRLPKSTIYRVLERLTASGAVRAIHLGGGPARYEVAMTAHPHAVCQVCHGILHLEHELVDALEQHLEQEHRFTTTRTDVVVVGVCADCAKGAEPAQERGNLEHVHYD